LWCRWEKGFNAEGAEKGAEGAGEGVGAAGEKRTRRALSLTRSARSLSAKCGREVRKVWVRSVRGGGCGDLAVTWNR
jgi:hypothetical protein